MKTDVQDLLSVIETLRDVDDLEGLRRLLVAHNLLTARVSAALSRVDVGADGALDPAQWLRTQAGHSHGDAARVARRAARVRACPALGTAWSSGLLTAGQVDAIVKHVSDRTEAVFADHGAELVPTLVGLSARQTDVVMQRWSSHAEALLDVAPPAEGERAVYLSSGLDGCGELSGRLDPAGFRLVEAALEAATVPDGEDEPPRSRAQQRADALVALGRHFLDHAEHTSTSRRGRPDVGVVVTLDELERRTGRTIDGLPVETAEMEALLCDAGVHRIVAEPGSVVLDAGRTTRTVSHHLFAALAVRDGGCRFPGCDRPVTWCEAHHVTPWQHGGETNQSNLVLLCWRHHHDFAHHPRWRLKLLPDATVEVTTPAGRVLTGLPPPIAGSGEAERWRGPGNPVTPHR